MAITGSHHHPSFQPTAEILHRERGEGDLTPSLQLHQVEETNTSCGRNYEWIEMFNITISSATWPTVG